MAKDRYEISLWEDYIVSAVYEKNTTEINKDEKYYYLVEENTYSSGFSGEEILKCQDINTEWFVLEEEKYILATEIKDDDTFYYYKTGNNYSNGISGKNIIAFRNKELEWYIYIPEHFEERKIAVIGSNTMTAQCRAIEPKLVENINGTNTLTFKMYYTYVDNETGERYSNPFIKLLVNERKIKAFWKNKWYDLIIKAIQEDSNGKSVTYTCKDLFANELSKNGFSLEFHNELGDNQGTIQELGEKVLEGTDWSIDDENTEVIQQTKEEPVYEGQAIVDFEAQEINGEKENIKKDTKVYLFYSTIQSIIQEIEKGENSGEVKFFQFATSPIKKGSNTTEMTVDEARNFEVEKVSWSYIETADSKSISFEIGNLTVIEVDPYDSLSNEYRIKRYVKSQKQVLDPVLGRLVYVYKKDNEEIYGYSETEYKDPTVVGNLVVNSKDFTGFEGWDVVDNSPSLVLCLYPEIDTIEENIEFNSQQYLRLQYKKAENEEEENKRGIYFNDISENGTYFPEGFSIGEKYIFRYQAYHGTDGKPNNNFYGFDYIKDENGNNTSEVNCLSLEPYVRPYSLNDKGEIEMGLEDTGYFTWDDNYAKEVVDDNGERWLEMTLTCSKSLSKQKCNTIRWGLFLVHPGKSNFRNVWLKNVELFPKVMGEKADGEISRINPGDMDKLSVATVKYKYYKKADKKEEIESLWEDTEPWELSNLELEPQYTETYEKIRSIEVKNSNRFNILQTLAETFECFLEFSIQHDETGKIKQNTKKVCFKNQIGQKTGIGFVYGIDLKTISRTINSDQITTKVIVPQNNNEFAKDGFCTIARSDENYSKENFVLNFDYYINQGLLDGGMLNTDLYSNTYEIDGSLGYYYRLNDLNTQYDTKTELLIKRKEELTEHESYLTVYEELLSSCNEQIIEGKAELCQLTGINKYNEKKVAQYIEKNPSDVNVKNKFTVLKNNQSSKNSYNTIYNNLEESVDDLTSQIEDLENSQKTLIEQKEELHEEFYKKYSRFIQEGSWTSEEYIDDNLYYLDAQSVAYTSSRPQISYNISVIRLNGLEEYKNKVFNLGDISFIQDTEFFGYTYVDQIKTPYKEEVLISEITSNFDSPEKDSFKVQNYKSRFEDLFQRITATTQSLQYASGQYQKAANAFTSTGEIKVETLQNSIAINNQLVYSSINDTVLQDSTGLTVVDTTNPKKKTKVTSGGIFITTDGGATWKNAVRGDGLSTQYLTSGNINTGSIVILDENFTSFRWDSTGINAFDQLVDENGEINGIDLGTFVRFDHYGLYGIKGYKNESGELSSFVPENEEHIWNDANFGLTWKGFFLKNKYGNGYVSISSTDDFVVNDGEYNRIKIGKIGEDENGNSIFGIRFKNADGATTLETDDGGNLWLRDKLSIGTLNNNNVSIGNLGLKQIGEDTENNNLPIYEDNEHGGRVIDANDTFVVYEDGSFNSKDGRLTNVYVEGEINATSGQIGGMTIAEVITNLEDVEKSQYKVQITSSEGIAQTSGTTNLTATLYDKNGKIDSGNISYLWFKNGVEIEGATTNIYEASFSDGSARYSCQVTYEEVETNA